MSRRMECDDKYCGTHTPAAKSSVMADNPTNKSKVILTTSEK